MAHEGSNSVADLTAKGEQRRVTPVPAGFTCISCGYDLRGLAPDSRCPECAEPIANSLKPNLLRFADPERLTLIARGARRIAINLLLYAICHVISFSGALWRNTPSGVQLWVLLTLAYTAIRVARVLFVWDFTAPCHGLRDSSALVRWRKVARIISITILFLTVFSSLVELEVFGDIGKAIDESTPMYVLYVLLSQLFRPLEFFLLALYGAILYERMDRHIAATRLRLLGIGCFLAESLFALPNTITWLQWFGMPLNWANTSTGKSIMGTFGIAVGIVAVLLTPVAIIAFLRLARKLRAAAEAGAEDQYQVVS